MTIGGITRETFLAATQGTREEILFDFLEEILRRTAVIEGKLKKMEFISNQVKDQCGRISALEKRKMLDTGIAATTGIIGGFIAILTKKLW